MNDSSSNTLQESKSLSSTYPALLSDLKERIRAAQVRAGLAVNREMVLLYWRIGREILIGSKVKAGEPKSSTNSPTTSVRPFPR